ncbi:MAG: hypothetical protein ACTTJ1_09355 [Treponema sp.]
MKKTIFLVFAIALSFSLYAKPKVPKLPKIPGVKDKIIKELDEVKQSAPEPQEEEKKEQPPAAPENKKSIKEIKQDLFTYISENNAKEIANAINVIENFAANNDEKQITCFYKDDKTGEEKEIYAMTAALQQDHAEAALAIQEIMRYRNAQIHEDCAHYNAAKCYATFKERYGDAFTHCYYNTTGKGGGYKQLPLSINKALDMGNENILQAMLADLNDADDTVLAGCARNGRKDIFDQVLTKEFDPEKSNALRWCAGQSNDIYYCKKLLALGLDVNKADTYWGERPAIEYAARNNRLEVVKYLEKFGAVISNWNGILESIKGNAVDTTTYFLSKGSNEVSLKEMLETAIKSDSEKIIPLLQKQGLKLSSRNLYDAVTENAVKSIQYLVKYGCNINDPKYPALKAALTSPFKGFHDNIPEKEIAQKREELVNLLLSLGAKVDTKYEDGTNALSYAKSVKMRQLLMAHME